MDHLSFLLIDFLFVVGAIRFLFLYNGFVDIFHVVVVQVLQALLRDHVDLDYGRVGHNIQETLHLILFLRAHVCHRLIAWLFERLWPEVNPFELHVHLKGQEAPSSELPFGEEF